MLRWRYLQVFCLISGSFVVVQGLPAEGPAPNPHVLKLTIDLLEAQADVIARFGDQDGQFELRDMLKGDANSGESKQRLNEIARRVNAGDRDYLRWVRDLNAQDFLYFHVPVLRGMRADLTDELPQELFVVLDSKAAHQVATRVRRERRSNLALPVDRFGRFLTKEETLRHLGAHASNVDGGSACDYFTARHRDYVFGSDGTVTAWTHLPRLSEEDDAHGGSITNTTTIHNYYITHYLFRPSNQVESQLLELSESKSPAHREYAAWRLRAFIESPSVVRRLRELLGDPYRVASDDRRPNPSARKEDPVGADWWYPVRTAAYWTLVETNAYSGTRPVGAAKRYLQSREYKRLFETDLQAVNEWCAAKDK